VSWLVQLAMALHHMHDRRVLHRDLKSRNIFLKRGIVKVGDFGIAKVLQGSVDQATSFAGASALESDTYLAWGRPSVRRAASSLPFGPRAQANPEKRGN